MAEASVDCSMDDSKYGQQYFVFKNEPKYQSYAVPLNHLFTNLQLHESKQQNQPSTDSSHVDLAQAFRGSHIETRQIEERVYETIINMVLCAHMTVEDHSGSCTGDASLQVRDEHGELLPMEVFARYLDLSLKESLGKVTPCSDCWMNKSWDRGLENKQLEALDMAVKLIRAIPDPEKQVPVFENTITKVLQRKLRPYGDTFIPVPATTRCISMLMANPGEMYIMTNRLSDITSTRPLSVWGSRSLEDLWLWIGHHDSIYGQNTTASKGDWVDFLNHILHQGPHFEGDGALTVNQLSFMSLTPVLAALPDFFLSLYQHGVRRYFLDGGKINSGELVGWLQRLSSRGWRTTSQEGYRSAAGFTSITRTEPERMELTFRICNAVMLSHSEDEQKSHSQIINDLNLFMNVQEELED